MVPVEAALLIVVKGLMGVVLVLRCASPAEAGAGMRAEAKEGKPKLVKGMRVEAYEG